LLGSAWVLISVILLIMALVLKQPALLIAAILFFLTSGVARIWSRSALYKVDFKHSLSSKRVFWGENINLDISLTNGKLLPLPWIHIEEEIPEEVTLLKGKSQHSSKSNRVILSSFLATSWYHRITRHYPVQCLKRGYFTFGPTSITSGDPFGFFRNNQTLNEIESLLVYPRIVPLEELGIPSRHPFGDLRIKRHLFEDPVQVMTTRDYVFGDPLKRIHWKSTAHMNRLQTKVFEHTTTVDLALFLDTRTVFDAYFWGNLVSNILENAVITAASLAAYSVNQGYKVGLYSNEYYRNSDRIIRLPPADHPDQLKGILEALANIQGIPAFTIEKSLAREARNLPWESSLVLITAVPTREVIGNLNQLRKTGRKISLVLIGKKVPEIKLDSIQTYHVSEDIYRNNLNTLSIRE
jgi:uncharacterized protein (DUF58 family)